MARHVMLNNVAHKNLRVIQRYGAEFGDNMASVLTFPSEYGDVQREYPIFFRRDPGSAEFQSIALLGLQPEENLFVCDGKWNASYIPAVVARGPFLIGFQTREEAGVSTREPVIHLDLDHPRVSQSEGELLFLPHGGNSRYLERIASILGGISDGLTVSAPMFRAFEAAGLIEPMKVEVRFSQEEQFDLDGLYSISEERLRNLDAATLHALNTAGFLQGAFLVVASLNNVKKLIDMKHERRRAAA
jgi:hypothetical protein